MSNVIGTDVKHHILHQYVHVKLCRHTFPCSFITDLLIAFVCARFRFHGVKLHVALIPPTVAMFEIFLQIQDFLLRSTDLQPAR
jgi:hypothetical protein